MIVTGTVKKNSYYDSVSLMIISREMSRIRGIKDSSVVMGTNENKKLLKDVGLFIRDFEKCDETDILIGIKAESDKVAKMVLGQVDQLLKNLSRSHDDSGVQDIFSYEEALKKLPGANLALISVAGKYAAAEAMKVMKQGLHVFLFSDNVGIKEELELKIYARDNGLLMMGPDCGTAIINGIPLGFANVVRRGNIGIVGASGTGIQEVSTTISFYGGGISQAIGTGGRDVRKEIGGIMFLEALKALKDDNQTKTIILISKPPDPSVLKKIGAEIRKIKKPVIAVMLGGDHDILRQSGAILARTLEEAGLLALSVSQGRTVEVIDEIIARRDDRITELAAQAKHVFKGRFIRGLFNGGTLCEEAQFILKEIIDPVYSNVPVRRDLQLKDSWKSRNHTVIDMGDDEFTRGRPHPMIDYSLRNKRILQEAASPGVGIILLDVVLGYGSHPDPASEIIPVIIEARQVSPGVLFIGSVTGTDQDPQNKSRVTLELEKAGMVIMSSNAAACELAGHIIRNISSR